MAGGVSLRRQAGRGVALIPAYWYREPVGVRRHFMIVVISMNTKEGWEASDGAGGYKRRFEKMRGGPVAACHYSEVSPEYLDRFHPRALFITGFGYSWNQVPVPGLYAINDLLHTTELPVYGACGGHQLIAFCFNMDLRKTERLPDEPMRRLEPGEPDFGPVCGQWGYYVARGVQEVQIVKRDPIFSGLPGPKIRVPEAHYCEIKTLPPGFELLATSPECRIEAMKHRERPIYGAQFHAEICQAPYTDGDQIMRNFFRIAGMG